MRFLRECYVLSSDLMAEKLEAEKSRLRCRELSNMLSATFLAFCSFPQMELNSVIPIEEKPGLRNLPERKSIDAWSTILLPSIFLPLTLVAALPSWAFASNQSGSRCINRIILSINHSASSGTPQKDPRDFANPGNLGCV